MLKHRKWGPCSVKTSHSGIVTLLEKGIKLEAYTLSGLVALLEKGIKLEAYTMRNK
jgi:hypothetical protein